MNQPTRISNATLHLSDCLDAMRAMPDASVDAIITDPPYGLSFMGKKWDYDVPDVAIWAECLRVLKPGGHLLAFAGTRTQHRMAVRIEDAGFEIRDMIAWVYGSGFPKSLDVSKAIDKAAGVEREVVGREENWGASKANDGKAAYGDFVGGWNITAPATEAAKRWQGWGTALKPSLEPITLARKPLIGTVAGNVLAHGTGSLNIDGCRVECEPGDRTDRVGGSSQKWGTNTFATDTYSVNVKGSNSPANDAGRWPANLIHDGSAEVLAVFPNSSVTGNRSDHSKAAEVKGTDWLLNNHQSTEYTDSGSAARFFYVAKASQSDRDEGLHHFEKRAAGMVSNTSGQHMTRRDEGYEVAPRANHHPTVKPTDLMRYLCRLVTPPHGVVLDPFMGSGSTGKAALLEDFRFIGIERDADYFAIACARIEHVTRQPSLFAA